MAYTKWAFPVFTSAEPAVQIDDQLPAPAPQTIEQICANKRSLIIVPTKLLAAKLYMEFRYGLVPYQTCMVREPSHAAQQLDLWSRNLLRYNFGVLIVVHPILAHGLRIACDQVIWIGDVPEDGTPAWANYTQAMNRAYPGTPKLHFKENEL